MKISKDEKNEKIITKKDLNKMVLNQGSLGMEFSWNYERQMNLPFAMMIDPILKKIYKNDPEQYKQAIIRHLEFFNITPQLAPFVGGVVASMEEMHAKGEVDAQSISSVKTALMGPLSGIGDSIFLGSIRIIALGVGLSLAKQGSFLGPLLYFLIYNIPAFLTRFYGARKGYELGFNYLAKMQQSGMMDKLMFAAGILGSMVIGGMTKDMVYTELALKIGTGKAAQSLQQILDGIIPGVIGLGVTWFYYWLLGKKVNPGWIILGTILVGVLGASIGLF